MAHPKLTKLELQIMEALWTRGTASIREAVGSLGGHATLFRAPEPIRLSTDVFDPPTEPVMALSRKLKEAFDPAGILNPGRLYPGV